MLIFTSLHSKCWVIFHKPEPESLKKMLVFLFDGYFTWEAPQMSAREEGWVISVCAISVRLMLVCGAVWWEAVRSRDLGSSLGFRKWLYYAIIHTPHESFIYSIRSYGLVADLECSTVIWEDIFCHFSTVLTYPSLSFLLPQLYATFPWDFYSCAPSYWECCDVVAWV